VGVDYVDLNFGLPLPAVAVDSGLPGGGRLVSMGRWILGASMALRWWWPFLVPAAVSALYVRPNESRSSAPTSRPISTPRAAPTAWNSAFARWNSRPSRRPLSTSRTTNRRWTTCGFGTGHAFHDTVTQIQALRPYYVFHDSDVDRYTIDGQYAKCLLAPRELDLSQLPAARANWINPAFIYTHGYGLCWPGSARSRRWLPVLLIDNAPPEVKSKSLKLTRPEIYYGEVAHEPFRGHRAGGVQLSLGREERDLAL